MPWWKMLHSLAAGVSVFSFLVTTVVQKLRMATNAKTCERHDPQQSLTRLTAEGFLGVLTTILQEYHLPQQQVPRVLRLQLPTRNKKRIETVHRLPSGKSLQARNQCINRLRQATWSVRLQWLSAAIAYNTTTAKLSSLNGFGNLEVASLHEILNESKRILLHMDASAAGVSFTASALA